MRAPFTRWVLSWVVFSIALGVAGGCVSQSDTPLFPASDGGVDAGAGAILSSDGSAKDLGSVVVGDQSAPATITILNTGGAATGPLASVVGGTDAGTFAIESDGCSGKPLAAGGRCILTLRFRPQNAGVKSASLAVAGSPGESVMVALTGAALTPGTLELTPSKHEFGAVAKGSSGADVAFTLTNKGGGASGPVAVRIDGSDKASFVITSDECTGVGLSPSGTCTVQVKLAPDSLGAKSASLSATALPGGSASSALTGTSILPGALAISPATDDFGSVVLGQTSADAPFTVTNTGQTASGAVAVALTGADAADFVIAQNGCTASLGAGASCTVRVALKPQTAGAKTASLGAAASPGGAVTAAITGRGLTPASITLTPSNEDFGSVVLGSSSADASFTVKNSGGATAGIPVASVGGANASDFVLSGGTCTSALAAGASCTLLAHFRPSASGARAGSLRVSASPGGASTATLVGSGLVPGTLTVTPPSQDFGSLVVGNSSGDVSLVITNSGGAATGAPAVSITGAASASFVIASNGCSGPLVANASCTVKVRFAPSSTGTKSATLAVTASPGGGASAALTGVALGAASLAMVPSTQDFGTVVAGSSSTDFVFTVTNNGGVSAGVPSPQLTGTNASAFVVRSSTCTSPLVAAGSCTVTVGFSPSSSGAKSATLAVTANPGGSAQSTLTGNALAPAQLAMSPATQSFGTVVIGNSSADVTFTVQNTGAVSSGVPSIAFSGADAGEIAVGVNGCTASLASGGQCTFTVRMTPTSAGAKSASVTVSASPGASASATLTGTAVTPGALTITPTSAPFGSVVTGARTADSAFTVTNTGGAPSGPLSVQLSGADPSEFTVDTSRCAAALAPNATCTVNVYFAPQTSGAKTATLGVTASPGGTASSALSGTALSPAQLSFTPASNDFLTVVVGQSSSNVSFTLTNLGGGASGVPAIGKSGTDANDFVIVSSSCTTALASGQSCTVTVAFDPASAGAKNAQLNASASPGGSATATLTGNAITPAQLSISPTSNNFLSSVIGVQTVDQTFVVTNVGAATSGSVTASLTGANAGDFVVLQNGCSAALVAGASCDVRVAFRPTAAGARSASLQATASPGGTTQSALSGTGLTPAALSVTPGDERFAATVVGSSSSDATFTVQNTGGGTSGAITVVVAGANSGDFAIGTNGCANATLAAAQSCVFTVHFQPAATGSKSATVTAVASPGGSAQATLEGTALTPAAIVISPTSDTFPGSVVGQTSVERSYIVSNGGGATSGALSFSFAGSDPTDFAIGTSSCTGALAGGASCTVGVRFTPRATGARSATLNVGANPGGAAQTMLAGTGLADASLSVAPTSWDYGSAALGSSGAHSFTISNGGGVASGVPSIVLGGNDAAQLALSVGTCNGPIAAGGTCAFSVSFNPTSVGAKSASVAITASPGGSASVALTGTGVAAAALSVVTPPAPFADTAVGQTSATQTIPIQNGGGVATGTLNASLGGANAADFRITADGCSGQTLAAGATCSVTVQMAPLTSGAKSASLGVTASPGGSATAALSGNAVAAADAGP